MAKNFRDMSDSEFDSLINDALATIDSVSKVDYSDDLEQRIKEIKADNSNTLKNRELDKEDQEERKKAKEKARALSGEADTYKKFRGLDSFKISFFRAIKNQVDKFEDEEDTWANPSRRHEEDPSIIVKGNRIDDVDENIPSIDVYFDQSGSWSDKDILIASRAVSVINEFKERGEIKLDIYYFAVHVHSDKYSARRECSTDAWDEILENIRAKNTQNVVLMTDTDMSWDARNSTRCIVPGCVWFIWRDNRDCPEIVEKLVGRSGNFQYSFDRMSAE